MGHQTPFPVQDLLFLKVGRRFQEIILAVLP